MFQINFYWLNFWLSRGGIYVSLTNTLVRSEPHELGNTKFDLKKLETSLIKMSDYGRLTSDRLRIETILHTVLKFLFWSRFFEDSREEKRAQTSMLVTLHATRSSHEKASCLSVRPSVCLSNEWIVTKGKKLVPIFLYHLKDHSL